VPPISEPTEPAATPLPTEPPLLRTIAMPADTNPNGDIFGGWIMGLMDLAAGNAAARRSRGRIATVAVNGLVFHSPVLVGDEVSIYGRITKVGRTSMTIEVQAWRRERAEDNPTLVTSAIFTFVAIDAARRPRAVPPA